MSAFARTFDSLHVGIFSSCPILCPPQLLLLASSLSELILEYEPIRSTAFCALGVIMECTALLEMLVFPVSF